jgi:hypothetical protein
MDSATEKRGKQSEVDSRGAESKHSRRIETTENEILYGFNEIQQPLKHLLQILD